jgi:hypothetical protein
MSQKPQYAEPRIPAGAEPFKKCSIEVSKLPLDLFLRANDGRKFLLKCRHRKALLLALASFANPDGTSCYPSTETLSVQVCQSRWSVAAYLRDLQAGELGFVVKGGYAWEDGPRVRRLIMPVADDAKIYGPGVRDSRSRSEGFAEQECGIEKQECGLGPYTTRQYLDPPELDPKERDQKSPSALASLSHSKPKAAGRDRAEAKALVNEIKKAALDASDGKVVFYAKNSKAIEQALIDNPALARESLLVAVRTRVQEMGTDEFRLAHCGSEIAEMLAPLVEYKTDARKAQARQDAEYAAVIAAAAERHRREEEELLAKRAEAEAETSMVGAEGKGLFS